MFTISLVLIIWTSGRNFSSAEFLEGWSCSRSRSVIALPNESNFHASVFGITLRNPYSSQLEISPNVTINFHINMFPKSGTGVHNGKIDREKNISPTKEFIHINCANDVCIVLFLSVRWFVDVLMCLTGEHICGQLICLSPVIRCCRHEWDDWLHWPAVIWRGLESTIEPIFYGHCFVRPSPALSPVIACCWQELYGMTDYAVVSRLA